MFGKFAMNSGESDEKTTRKDTRKISNEDFEDNSCFCLRRTLFVRKWFIHLVHWPYPLLLFYLVLKVLLHAVCAKKQTIKTARTGRKINFLLLSFQAVFSSCQSKIEKNHV